MTKITRQAKGFLIFIIGGAGYGLCELMWRGKTHPSMLLAGGIGFLMFYISEEKFHELALLYRCLFGGVLFTSVEFVFGCVFNMALKLNVWDYSDQLFHIWGQICLRYFILWVLLCIPLTALCKKLRLITANQAQENRPAN